MTKLSPMTATRPAPTASERWLHAPPIVIGSLAATLLPNRAAHHHLAIYALDRAREQLQAAAPCAASFWLADAAHHLAALRNREPADG